MLSVTPLSSDCQAAEPRTPRTAKKPRAVLLSGSELAFSSQQSSDGVLRSPAPELGVHWAFRSLTEPRPRFGLGLTELSDIADNNLHP